MLGKLGFLPHCLRMIAKLHRNMKVRFVFNRTPEIDVWLVNQLKSNDNALTRG